MRGNQLLKQGTSEDKHNVIEDTFNDTDFSYFIIHGRLESLNEYIERCRRNKYAGGAMKRKSQDLVINEILIQAVGVVDTPIRLIYRFYEPNNKRDCDNVASYGIKVIQDALVEAGVIPDDSRKYITGYEVEFYTDKENPRIEVVIMSER